MNDETIMPDGRPLFAWKNELDFLRASKINLERMDKENVIFREAMGLIYEHWNDPASLEWKLRIKATGMVNAKDFRDALKNYLEIV
jgi:hypothetical protein